MSYVAGRFSADKEHIHGVVIYRSINLYESVYVLCISGEREYYERQFETLKSFEKVDSLHSSNAIDEELELQELAGHERAMNISNWANVFLLGFKVID